MKCTLGIDIGGTGIKTGIVDENCCLLYKDSFPTRSADGGDAIVSDIIARCKPLFEKYEITSVGVGCPGDKDDSNTVILGAGNLPFRGMPIVSELKNAFGTEVFLENDGSSALIGEWLAGSGKGKTDMVMITVGTGIGGGCVVGGQLLRGLNNDGGELGHFVINFNGPHCPCGQNGCFEQYASARALVRMTKEAAESNPDSVLGKYAKESLSGRTVFKAVAQGCNIAEKVLDEYGKLLAAGINGLNYIFAPQIITIAGGVAREGESLLRFVRPYLLCSEKVLPSMLNGDAGVIGAAMLYRFADYYLSLRK